jgi:hypothetical protein
VAAVDECEAKINVFLLVEDGTTKDEIPSVKTSNYFSININFSCGGFRLDTHGVRRYIVVLGH